MLTTMRSVILAAWISIAFTSILRTAEGQEERTNRSKIKAVPTHLSQFREVNTFALSPDGARLFVATPFASELIVARSADLTVLDNKFLDTSMDLVFVMAFPRGNRLLITTAFDEVSFVDSRSFMKLATILPAKRLPYDSVFFSPDISSDGERVALVWDDRVEVRATDADRIIWSKMTPGATGAAFTQSGDYLVVAGKSPEIWSARTGEQMRALSVAGLNSSTGKPAVSPGDKFVSALTEEDGIVVWNFDTGEQLQNVRPERGSFWSSAWFEDNGHLSIITGTDRDEIFCIEVPSGKVASVSGAYSMLESVKNRSVSGDVKIRQVAIDAATRTFFSLGTLQDGTAFIARWKLDDWISQSGAPVQSR